MSYILKNNNTEAFIGTFDTIDDARNYATGLADAKVTDDTSKSKVSVRSVSIDQNKIAVVENRSLVQDLDGISVTHSNKYVSQSWSVIQIEKPK